MNKNLTKIKQAGEKYGLSLTDDKLKKFELFVEYLTAYNSHTNLVSSNDVSLIYDKHIIDSLAFGKYLANAQDYKIYMPLMSRPLVKAVLALAIW